MDSQEKSRQNPDLCCVCSTHRGKFSLKFSKRGLIWAVSRGDYTHLQFLLQQKLQHTWTPDRKIPSRTARRNETARNVAARPHPTATQPCGCGQQPIIWPYGQNSQSAMGQYLWIVSLLLTWSVRPVYVECFSCAYMVQIPLVLHPAAKLDRRNNSAFSTHFHTKPVGATHLGCSCREELIY